MLVAMSSERAHAFFVANGDAVTGRDLADATQLEFRKLQFPGVEQRNSVFARHRKEQFEILAVREGGEQRGLGGGFGFGGATRFAADGNGSRMELGADPA